MRPAGGCASARQNGTHCVQRRDGQFRGRAKKMQMIRHDKRSVPPASGWPCANNQAMSATISGLASKDGVVCTNGYKLENGLIRKFQGNQMRKSKAAWFLDWLWHEARLSRIWIARKLKMEPRNWGLVELALRMISSNLSRCFRSPTGARVLSEAHRDVADEQATGIGDFQAGRRACTNRRLQAGASDRLVRARVSAKLSRAFATLAA